MRLADQSRRRFTRPALRPTLALSSPRAPQAAAVSHLRHCNRKLWIIGLEIAAAASNQPRNTLPTTSIPPKPYMAISECSHVRDAMHRPLLQRRNRRNSPPAARLCQARDDHHRIHRALQLPDARIPRYRHAEILLDVSVPAEACPARSPAPTHLHHGPVALSDPLALD